MFRRPVYRVRRMPSGEWHGTEDEAFKHEGEAEHIESVNEPEVKPSKPENTNKVIPLETGIKKENRVPISYPDPDIERIHKTATKSPPVYIPRKQTGRSIHSIFTSNSGKRSLFKLGGLGIALDDLILIALLIVFLVEGIDDDLLIAGLIFLFIAGWE